MEEVCVGDGRRKRCREGTYNLGVSLVLIVVAYLLGSLNFGVLVARSRGVDIYSEGSGNPGTSNVMRVLGKKLAAVVLLGDGAKGAIAAALGASVIDPAFGYVTLFVAVVGHAFPVWHRFRGGKSVATAIGGLLYLAPPVGAILAGIWIVTLVVWKTASIGSLIVMALMVPLLAITGRNRSELAWSAAIAIFVVARHSSNIKLLLNASERKVS
ncbi:MAG: glycerol-3-phosphate 1-O-acyltransferase PlsY [Acidimicrobiia bacterium]|nr:MAG: glycerol-3-phosphate 1-O-acyltransferase PlsY [Acidimicrobiia bacterium]